MSPELEQKLYINFPELFRGRYKSQEESSMYLGFMCDDKWFDLLWKHCLDIEALADQEGRERHSDNWPEARQVKEKFWTLRFYMGNESDAMRELRYKLLEDSKK